MFLARLKLGAVPIVQDLIYTNPDLNGDPGFIYLASKAFSITNALKTV